MVWGRGGTRAEEGHHPGEGIEAGQKLANVLTKAGTANRILQPLEDSQSPLKPITNTDWRQSQV
jgi:hypothetical protein